jgi:hypothetical protein
VKSKRDYLLETADYIEQHPEKYNFGTINTCQCGILAQVVLTQEIGDLDTHPSFGYSWRGILEDNYPSVCTTTGLNISQVVEALFSVGFTKQELIELEALNSFEVLNVLEKGTYCADPKDVVLYLRTWAALLSDN